jgi:hypothetical protein
MGNKMSATFTRENIRIAQILKWDKEKQLVLQPKFQRRLSWEPKARSYLIDTIIREFPMPKFYLRMVIHPRTKRKVYEVVDGQQRLQAIIDFYKGRLKLSKLHNPEFGDLSYSGLPDPVQYRFSQYELSTEIMENATDPEVFKMFERLNSYTLTLNAQEHRNARFFGFFKQTAYNLAAEQPSLDAWRNLRVFSDQQIARMSEVELTSDVLVAIVDGISDITDITKTYKKYDDEFPKQNLAEDTFRKALAFVAKEFPEVIRKTKFRNRTWFYSLMVAAADTLVGINDGRGPGKMRPPNEIRKRMFALDAALRLEPLPPGLGPLSKAFSRQTSHVPQRRTRHTHFYDLLNLPQETWNIKWGKLSAPP